MITGSIDLGRGPLAVTVDHDPTSVSTDVPAGTFIIDANGVWWRKTDDGSTSNVVCVGFCKNNRAATAAPTVNDDSDHEYGVGSRWINVTTDKEYVCLDATVTAAVWTETTQSGGGGDISFAFLSRDFDFRETNSLTYESMGKFIFRGTTALGSPSAVKFIIWNGEAGGSHYARIYDLTNSNVIAEVGSFSGMTPVIQTDSSLVSLPAGESIFEVQVRDVNGKKTRISAMLMVL